ncbi:pilus assembly protein CpaB [Roseivivax lentus]|uniref:Pilus assembly protein CpaB n=1 Tax=Roseivivax lentus TaxID=633194 RepID=A0A1N7M8W1_9RHOB|nr:Flp pilus assembly protein CpaB [Roseivivax lentus]SIS82517.1 pilus assembly protein CpaB [Roseivivax lentus]
MKLRSFATFFLGISIAGAGAFTATQINMAPTAATAMPGVGMVAIVTAQTEIAYGEPLDPAMLTLRAWPENAVIEGSFTDITTIFEDGTRRTLSRIFPGEPILAAKLSAPNERVTIVQKLSAGHRAVSISIDAATGVGGFVTPGDRVDIVMTAGSGTEIRAVTVLQNIRVVGIDQISEEQRDKPMVARTVTVEVTPEDSQRLALAQRAGRLSLSLRELDAPDFQPISQIGFSDLFAVSTVEEPASEDEAAPQPVLRRPSILLRRGTDDAEEIFLK